MGDVVVNALNHGFCDDAEVCTDDGCDGLTGCYNDPIPQCNAEVDTLPPSGRAWLIVFSMLAAGLVMSRRQLLSAR